MGRISNKHCRKCYTRMLLRNPKQPGFSLTFDRIDLQFRGRLWVRISESLPHHSARISESGYTNVRFRDSEIPLLCSGGDSEITTQKALLSSC